VEFVDLATAATCRRGRKADEVLVALLNPNVEPRSVVDAEQLAAARASPFLLAVLHFNLPHKVALADTPIAPVWRH